MDWKGRKFISSIEGSATTKVVEDLSGNKFHSHEHDRSKTINIKARLGFLIKFIYALLQLLPCIFARHSGCPRKV